MQQFYKGRTNNHLTWVMVDATDFATPESALSAATKIKIYGKLRSATGVNFVSSGTGSLTNDIQHVGASVLGIYTIALAKADLSDASAAWYDQYVVSLSATGAAYQTLIIDGGIDNSYMSNVVSYLSNMISNASVIQSDVYSAVIVTQSGASDAASAAAQANSRVLVIKSDTSDIKSLLAAGVPLDTSTMSDVRSAINALTVTITASDVSDIASAVVAGLPVTSAISDIYSLLSDLQSDFQSRVPKRVATDSQLSDLASDLKSAVTIVQSMASDAASAAQQTNSRVLLNKSVISDIYSLLSDVSSDIGVMSGIQSDIYSALTSTRAEPGQTAPSATTDVFTKIDFLYKAWRNRTKQTTTKYILYNDDGTTIGQSTTASDDGATSFVRGEVGIGT